MKFNIAVIKGDGIGPEIVESAIRVLDKVAEKFSHEFTYTYVCAGGCAIDRFGEPLPEHELKKCLESDSVLLGAVGGPKWDKMAKRPEQGLLAIRKALDLYANIRPAKLFPELIDACPLRKETAEAGFDMVIVRELTGGIYYGERGRKTTENGRTAYDTESYSETEIERIAHIAFKLAGGRNKKVTSIDKANVLESSKLWRETVEKVAKLYPDIEFSNMLVDNAAMQLVKNPKQFDVILTPNMFGDILSDEAAQLTGSIGMLPSASLSGGTRGMYEPIHGSAPDIAGKGIANPLATILSTAMMLELSFNLTEEAKCIQNAVASCLKDGCRTADIAAKDEKVLTTKEITQEVLNRI